MTSRTLNESLDGIERVLLVDFCPSLNRYVMWLKTPLGVLIVAALVSLLCGVTVGAQGYVLLASVLAIIGLGLVWPWIGLRCVDCELQFPAARATEGSRTTAVLVIRNRAPWPVWGLAIEKGFFVDADDSHVAVALAQVPAWSRSEFCWEFTPPMRGKYPRELPELTSEFPFGLWKCQKSVAATQELIAWPQCEPWRKPYDHGDRSEECAAQSDERAGNHGDVLGVRPFRHGDQLRNVHWSLSARADELMVKERETASISRAVIRVDLDPSHHAGVGRDHSLERCIRIAAGMCQQFTQQGVPLTLELGSRRLSLSPRRESLAVALDALATAQCEHANAATPCSTRHDASAIYWVTTDLNAHVRVHRRAIVVATGSACQASSDLRTNSACHIARTSTR